MDAHDAAVVQVAHEQLGLVGVEGDPVDAEEVRGQQRARNVSCEQWVLEPDASLARLVHAPDAPEERVGHVEHAAVVEGQVVGKAVGVERRKLLHVVRTADSPDERARRAGRESRACRVQTVVRPKLRPRAR